MRRESQSGVAIIEFALVLPFLLLLSLITIEYGRALYQYNAVVKSTRDAVRFLSMRETGVLTDEARNIVVYGNVVNTGLPLSFGLSVDKVKTPIWEPVGTNPIINAVTVTVSGCGTSPPPCYKFTPVFSGAFGFNFGEFDYADISATMRGAPL